MTLRNRAAILLAVLLVAGLLTACTPKIFRNSVQMPEAWLPKPGEATGKVLGSVGALGVTGTSHVLVFRPAGTKPLDTSKLGQFRWRGFVEDRIYFERKDGLEFGETFHIDLPVGNYEIMRVVHQCDYGCGSDNMFISEDRFSIPFRVDAGETVYLGRFLAVPRQIPGDSKRRGYFPTDIQFTIVDEAGDDIRLYEKATGRTIDQTRFRKEIADPAAVHPSYFRAL